MKFLVKRKKHKSNDQMRKILINAIKMQAVLTRGKIQYIDVSSSIH